MRQKNIKVIKDIHFKNSEMRKPLFLILHGIFFLFYGFFKYLSFPFFGSFRYAICRVFGLKSAYIYIADGVTFFFPWRIKIGKNTTLNQGVLMDGFGYIFIGNNVRIAPDVIINTTDHSFSHKSKPICQQGFVSSSVIIEDDVWIGAKSCINKGITIGKGSIIGAGSVITKDVEKYSIVAGVPGRLIQKR